MVSIGFWKDLEFFTWFYDQVFGVSICSYRVFGFFPAVFCLLGPSSERPA